MKKLISLTLALIMVFSLATVAMAEDSAPATPNNATSIVFVKNYVDDSNNKTNLVPKEDLTFTITSPTGAPKAYIGTAPNTTGVYTVAITSNAQTITVNLPAASEYSSVGEYEYTIQETMTTAEGSQGVSYGNASYKIKVQVLWNDAHTALVTNAVVYSGTTKTSDLVFVNTYSLGELGVKKVVTGKLADKTAQFDMTVTFTSDKIVMSEIAVSDGKDDHGATTTIPGGSSGWTKDEQTGKYTATAYIKVSDSETVNFTGIPVGVSYKVEEDAKHLVGTDGFDVNSSGDTDYTESYDNQTGTISSVKVTATVTNTKDVPVDTGITLDTLPFVLILAVCAGAVVLFVIKRRRSVDF